jgi:hypothetical protein
MHCLSTDWETLYTLWAILIQYVRIPLNSCTHFHELLIFSPPELYYCHICNVFDNAAVIVCGGNLLTCFSHQGINKFPFTVQVFLSGGYTFFDLSQCDTVLCSLSNQKMLDFFSLHEFIAQCYLFN